ncbi:Ig-like domain-containing protein [Baekduia sp. Peel2402]|uniref:Ig-like domain-containing protein n=1 Tax=Baekduia sp. Peel2402 TaxID=3458296 RepID=UPI00403E8DA4
MRIPKILTSVVALAAFAIPTTTAHAAEPGVNASSPDHATLAEALATGAKSVRLFVSWAELESGGRGTYTPAGGTGPLYDAAIQQLNAAGAKPLFVVLNTPSWANGVADQLVPPNDPQDYANFIGAFAAHNKTIGDVAGYEVWNEPDENQFWHPGPDAGRYAALLKASYTALKAADPRAAVVSGPTTGNNYQWIQGLYSLGAGSSFDVVAVHTDTACLDRGPDAFYREDGKLARYTFLGYRTVHDVMAANGDANKPIWMSELGWSSTGGGPTSCTRGEWAGKKPSGVSEADQATFLTKAYECLANDPYVQKADWFTLRDLSGNSVDELNHYGLTHTNGAAKPSLNAFKAVTAANGGSAATCGDFDAPSIRVIKPTPGQQFVDKLDLQAAATDGGVGVARITFAYDTNLEIRNFTDGLANNVPVGLAPWQGSGKLALGAHTVIVTALDKNGNTQTVQVPVVKVNASSLKSTLTPTVKLKTKKVKCTKKRVCTVSGSISRAAAVKALKGAAVPSLGGKVAVEWQFKNKKGKFRKLAGGLKPANKPFTFKTKLKNKGTWRVRVVYQGQAPWKKATSKFLTFKVK